jgi:hypothetical protein
LGEHALSLIMGKDCRFSEALITDERDICEAHGSPRTKNDFQGILIAGTDAEGEVVRAAPMMMSASEGSLEDSSVDAVLEKIRSAQQTQYAQAEQRVAARTRQANEALLAFASSAPKSPNSIIAPAPTEVAEYKPIVSGTVVVLRLAPLAAPVAVAQAEAETPDAVATPVQVASVTPIRKPLSFQIASAEVIEATAPEATVVEAHVKAPVRKPASFEIAAEMTEASAPAEAKVVEAKVVEEAPAPAPAPARAEADVAAASLLSGSRLIVPLSRPVTLISTTGQSQ